MVRSRLAEVLQGENSRNTLDKGGGFRHPCGKHRAHTNWREEGISCAPCYWGLVPLLVGSDAFVLQSRKGQNIPSG